VFAASCRVFANLALACQRRGSDTLVNIEDLQGGAGGDTLNRDGNDNQLLGEAGTDTLAGGDAR